MRKPKSQYSNAHNFKNHHQEKKLLMNRSIIASSLVLVLLLALLARCWYLQVVRFEDYQTRSNNNRISIQSLAPKRGLIYDRNGILLANNRSIYSLEIIPEKVKSIKKTLEKLITIGLIDKKNRDKFLTESLGQRRFKSIPVKSRLTEKEVAIFSVNRHRFPGVSVEARLVRHYPFGETLAHALGYVGRINNNELAVIDQANYKATRHIGKVGLEKYYETTLHGKVGFRRVETDVQGRVIGKALYEELPEPGKNIKLSIDVRLQQVAIQALGEERGAVVAINPNTGEVLALISNPAYNPNDFVTGISSANYQALTSSEDRPFIAWIGLEKKLITTQTTIYDPGYWVIPTKEARIYRDWKPGGHGMVNLNVAITESCDPYFYDLAYRMGIDTLSEGMKQFGFGQYTDIDMGEEVPGNMPSREWKRRERKQPWFPGETVITGIGQGYWTSTPLQLVNSMAQLATGGERYKLRLLKATQTEEGWIETNPEITGTQVDFSNHKNLKAVQKAMYKVTQFPQGTARTAFQDAQYHSAGKTGTVQLRGTHGEKYDESKVEKKFWDNALYVGYAPYEDPQIVMAIVAENAGSGGAKAAPIARQIFDEYFKNIELDNDNIDTNKVDKNKIDINTSHQTSEPILDGEI